MSSSKPTRRVRKDRILFKIKIVSVKRRSWSRLLSLRLYPTRRILLFQTKMAQKPRKLMAILSPKVNPKKIKSKSKLFKPSKRLKTRSQ
jgi:hypothetical protein